MRDRFVVLHRIATTGLNRVYRGVDQVSGRSVAIKQVAMGQYPGGIPRHSALQALRSEAQLLRKLHNPHVPRLRAAFGQCDTYVLVTDYAAGTTLSTLLEEGSITPRLAWQIAFNLCDAVDDLHGLEVPVIHADIKPNNIVVGARGEVTLIDFGLARLRGAPSPVDTVMGTPPYSPPEQWNDEPLDERSDLFALAKVLEEIFTAADIITAHQAVKRATAEHPEARFDNVQELRQAIVGAMVLDSAKRRARPFFVLDRWIVFGWMVVLLLGALFLAIK